jgi:hypothetical protein
VATEELGGATMEGGLAGGIVVAGATGISVPSPTSISTLDPMNGIRS